MDLVTSHLRVRNILSGAQGPGHRGVAESLFPVGSRKADGWALMDEKAGSGLLQGERNSPYLYPPIVLSFLTK